MFKDLIDAFQQAGVERIRNPFLGTFAFSWCACNWRVFAYLFLGDNPIERRIEFIEASGFDWWTPFQIAAGYVIAMPWISYGVQLLQAFPTKKRKIAKLKHEAALAEQRGNTARAQADADLSGKKVTLAFERESRLEDVKRREAQLDQERANIEEQERRHASDLDDLKKRELLLKEIKESVDTEQEGLKEQIAELDAKSESIESHRQYQHQRDTQLIDWWEKSRDDVAEMKRSIATSKAKLHSTGQAGRRVSPNNATLDSVRELLDQVEATLDQFTSNPLQEFLDSRNKAERTEVNPATEAPPIKDQRSEDNSPRLQNPLEQEAQLAAKLSVARASDDDNLIDESDVKEEHAVQTVRNSVELSTEAKSILISAASGDGQISHTSTHHGDTIHAGSKTIFEGNDQRAIANWVGGIEELERHRLIISVGRRSETFEVTREGYELADKLCDENTVK